MSHYLGGQTIISLEPYPYTFASAKKNIDLSEFKNKIELINAGYGEDKKIIIDTSFIPDSGSGIRENENGTEINLFSLKTLMSKYDIVSGILKMDCEGCEYNLLKEANETIRKFSMIQIEYHYGYEKLVNKLKECGFDTKFTLPTKFYSPTASNQNMLVGYVFGTRTEIPKAPLPST